MIKNSYDVRPRQIHGAQGGEGNVWFYDWPDRDELSEHGRVFSRLVIAPGASIGVHTHEGEIEAYYVSKGHPTVIDNGEEIQLNPGDMHICKNHDSHGTKNVTDEEVELFVFILKDLSDRFSYDGPNAKELREGAGRVKVGNTVKHFKYETASDEDKKNRKYIYQVLDFATDTHTGRPVVLYMAVNRVKTIYKRDYEEFISTVDREKYPNVKQEYRFEVVEI